MKADFSSHATVRGQEERGKNRRATSVQSTVHREINSNFVFTVQFSETVADTVNLIYDWINSYRLGVVF